MDRISLSFVLEPTLHSHKKGEVRGFGGQSDQVEVKLLSFSTLDLGKSLLENLEPTQTQGSPRQLNWSPKFGFTVVPIRIFHSFIH